MSVEARSVWSSRSSSKSWRSKTSVKSVTKRHDLAVLGFAHVDGSQREDSVGKYRSLTTSVCRWYEQTHGCSSRRKQRPDRGGRTRRVNGSVFRVPKCAFRHRAPLPHL